MGSGSARTRQLLLVVVVLAGVALLPWAGHLGQVLPEQHVSAHWRTAWVGLDVAVAACLLAAAWLGVRRHRAAVQLCAAAAALLVCDAWFDVLLDGDLPGRPFGDRVALAVAVAVELGSAGALLLLARPLVAGGVRTVVVDPVHVEAVHTDDDCRQVLAALEAEGAATAQVLATAAGLPLTLVTDVLDRLHAAGAARRRWDSRWERLAQDLRWPDPDGVAWRRPDDRGRYEAFLDAKYDRELRIAERAVRQRAEFGAWSTGSRSSAHLTPAELLAFEREYHDLLRRYSLRRRRPEAGTRTVALRLYAFPQDVVDAVDAELAREARAARAQARAARAPDRVDRVDRVEAHAASGTRGT